jgi:hypothetical protein
MNSGHSTGPSSRRFRALNLALLAGFSVLYFALTVVLAQRQPLWFDEFLTYHLARLPSISSIWDALGDGPDASPPLNLVAVHAVYQVAGDGPVATRLPAIVGVWVMSLCLYVFVARRCAPIYAWTALLFPLTTVAQTYAYEGRPYGLWLGLCGLALVSWQAAIGNGPWRPLALAGLALSLAGTISTHFYAAVGFIPFGLAELARTWRRRRIDMPMWIALVAGLIPMAFFGPFIRNAKAYSSLFYSRPGLTAWLLFYTWLLSTSLPALVAALAGLGADATLASGQSRQEGENQQASRALPPLEEMVVAFGFAAIPLFVMILSRVAAGGAFVERYSLPAVIGLTVLVAFLASSVERRRRMGYILAIAIFGGAAYVGYIDRQLIRFKNAIHSQQLGKLLALNGLPIATDDPCIYLVLHYYGSPDLTSRLTYLTGFPEGTADRCVQKLDPWVKGQDPLRIKNYVDFVAAHRRFFFCTGTAAGGLIKRKDSVGLRFELKDDTSGIIYEASSAEGSVPSPAGEMRKTADVAPQGRDDAERR